MAYCKKCGAQIADDATVCPFCNSPTNALSFQDSDNFLWSVAGFFLPIPALIAYLVLKNKFPMLCERLKSGLITYFIVVIVLIAGIILVPLILSAFLAAMVA